MATTSTIYESLVNRLKADILAGKYTADQMLGTEIGLATEAGISRGSVRMAIDTLVREGLVERRAGKGVFIRKSSPSTRIVEIILPDLDGMWAEMAKGAQDWGADHHVKVQVYNANRNFEGDLRAIRMLPGSSVDGGIIGAMHQSRMNQVLVELWQTGFPFVLCDQRLQDVDVPSVVFDNHQAGYLAAQELIRLGHRRIGFVGFKITGLSGSRFEGFRDAVNDAGIPFDRTLSDVHSIDDALPDDAPTTDQFFESFRSRPNRPTALVFHNEGKALGGCRMLKRLGFRIPEDIAVLVIGRKSQGETQDPAWTMIDLPFTDMGRIAIDMLMDRIKNPGKPAEHRVLPVRLTPGDSVRPQKPS